MPAYRPFWLGIERRKKPLNYGSSAGLGISTPMHAFARFAARSASGQRSSDVAVALPSNAIYPAAIRRGKRTSGDPASLPRHRGSGKARALSRGAVAWSQVLVGAAVFVNNLLINHVLAEGRSSDQRRAA